MRRVYGLRSGWPGLGLLAALSCVAGCASTGADREAGAGGSAEPLPAVAASRVFTPGPASSSAVVFDEDRSGEGGGERVGVQRTEVSAADANGAWSTRTVVEGEKPREAGYVRTEDGGVALAWSRSVKDTDPDGPARLYVFDPPLVMLPASLEAGSVFEHETRMTERDPEDEGRVVLTGRAVRTARVVGPDDAAWAFGPADAAAGARAVVGLMRIHVGPASAARETVTLVAPGPRDGEEVVDYSIRVLGLRVKHERTRVVPARAAAK